MISIPGIMLLGFSPQTAVAITQVGDIGAFLSAAGEYWESKKIDWKMAAPLILVATVGSVIGAQIMVNLNTDFLRVFIGIMILAFLPLFFFSKELGLKQRNTSKTKKAIGLSLYFLAVIEGAIVPAGGATILLMIMMYFFGYEIIKGYATNTPAELFSSLVPAVVYGLYGFIQLWPAVIIFMGMLIGGFIGARTALEMGNRWVKNLFTLVVLAIVIKILFF